MLIYIKLVGISYLSDDAFEKIGICALLYIMSVLEFCHFCLSYEKVNYCKIRKSIIRIAISSDRKHSSLYLCLEIVFMYYF